MSDLSLKSTIGGVPSTMHRHNLRQAGLTQGGSVDNLGSILLAGISSSIVRVFRLLMLAWVVLPMIARHAVAADAYPQRAIRLIIPYPQAGAGDKGGAALRPLVSAVLARGVRAVIPLFFYADKIAAAKMLLFFRKSTAMDILTRRVDKEVRYGSGQGYEEGFHGHLRHCAF